MRVGGTAASPCVGPCSQCLRRGLLHNGCLSSALGSHPHVYDLRLCPQGPPGSNLSFDCPLGWGHQRGADLQPLGATAWLLKNSMAMFGWGLCYQVLGLCKRVIAFDAGCPVGGAPKIQASSVLDHKPSSQPDLLPSLQSHVGAGMSRALARPQCAERQDCSPQNPQWRLLWEGRGALCFLRYIPV